MALILGTVSFAAEISISRINYAKSGERRTVTISADSIVNQISGFNLLVAYDQSLSFVYGIRPGDLHKNHGWEYFNYRLIVRDTLSAHMPGFNVHLINIIGLASLSGAPPLPLNLDNLVLAELDVVLALSTGSFSDEIWSPFSFFWRDCNDNVLTSLSGDTLYAASQLYENRFSIAPRDPVSFAFPGFGIPNSPCSPPNGEAVQQNINFVNSGVWSFVTDPDEECYNGDVNLNGIPYEVADVVAFIDFFIYGIGGLCGDFPALPCEAMIAQTDCDCDGLVLSIGDVVCFIRKTIGDDRFHPKPVSDESHVKIVFERTANSKYLKLESAVDVDLAYLRIYPKGNNKLESGDFRIKQSASRTGLIGDTITILLVDLEGNPVLSAGEHQLFEYSGNSEFEIEALVVDMNGQETALKFESVNLPHSPELLQNYPNPFNPSTTIEFTLPNLSNWKLEIYNLAGQLIRNFGGTTSGPTEVEWDGTNFDKLQVASGVYFYKLISRDATLSRKMLLLK